MSQRPNDTAAQLAYKATMRLILGSSSIYRKNILSAASLEFVSEAPPFDESGFKRSHPTLSPKELCEALALGKAQSLKSKYPEDVVLGCDQLIDLEGEILGKSHNFENALNQLKAMSGKTHKLHTSMAVLTPQGEKVLTTTTEVTFRVLKDSELKQYIEIEQPFDCAGSYKMEKAGLILAKSVLGPDPTAVQGLSLIDLVTGLRDLGLSIDPFLKGKSQ